jgi:hypothetical protein
VVDEPEGVPVGDAGHPPRMELASYLRIEERELEAGAR